MKARDTGYNRKPIEQKRTEALDRAHEPPVDCPAACGVRVLPVDLPGHVARCSGPRGVHPRARWYTWREVLGLGVARATLRRLVVAGIVRTRGPKRHTEYLARDLVLALAWRERLAQTRDEGAGNPGGQTIFKRVPAVRVAEPQSSSSSGFQNEVPSDR